MKDFNKCVLSLDISSTCIGYAVFSMNENCFKLISYGNIKPIKDGSLSERLYDTGLAINVLIDAFKPDEVAVEDYVLGFSRGRSSANTIRILSVFNEMISLKCFEILKKNVHRYSVSAIRAELSKFYGRKIISKLDAASLLMDNAETYKPTLNKAGLKKSESYDELDAIAVGICYALKQNPLMAVMI